MPCQGNLGLPNLVFLSLSPTYTPAVMKHVVAFGLLWSAFSLHAQTLAEGFSRASFEVLQEDVLLTNPWVGGLTAPQWSTIDADLDGDDDLFAFDRDGSRLLLFERVSEGNGLQIRWDWVEGWPAMVDWCLLRDYNCDGKADIFTSHQNGIRVYTNTTVVGGPPTFDPEPVTLFASFDFGQGPDNLPVICIGMDKPAIVDHDDDGDIDIITFTETSTTLYRFLGQTPCGLDLVCTNRCYGMMAEAAENNAMFIGPEFDCDFNVVDPRTGVHAGGSITALQLESGGPKDLLISDVTYPTTLGIVLEEGGSSLDSATYIDPEFPANLYGDQAVNLPRFPAAFHLDVDQDGVRDLLFSPNTALETDDDRSVHYFRNEGTEDVPAWTMVQDDYLQEGMLDFGRGAYPVLIDFDGDGLLDLAVANKERYEGVDQTPAAIACYRNDGTETSPSFVLQSMDWVDLSTYQIESPFPAFGDLDGDGDLDLIVGDELGLLHEFTNVAEPGEWPSYELSVLSLTDGSTGDPIDVGQFAAPQLIDVDADGNLDLVVGEKNGTLTLMQRNSLGLWEVYDSPINGVNFGGVVVDNLLGINGYSTPCLTQTSNGIRAFVANETGTVQDFGLVPSNLDATWEEVDNEVLGTANGFRAAVALADLNADGLLDALLGIQNGGLMAFQGGTVPDDVNEAMLSLTAKPNPLTLAPNPGTDVVRWTTASPWNGTLCLFDQTGRCVQRTLVFDAKEGMLSAQSLAPGVYLVRRDVQGQQKGASAETPLQWVKVEGR